MLKTFLSHTPVPCGKKGYLLGWVVYVLHVSAEKEKTGGDTRISQAAIKRGRKEGDKEEESEREKAPHAVSDKRIATMLKKHLRLSGEEVAEIRRRHAKILTCREEGKFSLALFFRERTGNWGNRFAVVVAGGKGKSVARNRLRRKLYERLRKFTAPGRCCYDVVVAVKIAAPPSPAQEEAIGARMESVLGAFFTEGE